MTPAPAQRCKLLVIAAADIALDHHQVTHEMRIARGGEKGRVRTHRLPDEHDWSSNRRGVDDGGNVVDEGIARQIVWHAGAATMAALIEGHRAATRE